MAADNLEEDEKDFLNEDTKAALLTWAVVTREIAMKTERASLADLFNKKYRYITSILWVDWFSNIFIYYGLIFMIPLTLYEMNGASKGKDDLVVLIIIAAAELPAALVCFLLVDRKEFGRKNLMALGYLFVGIAMAIGTFFLQENHFLVWISSCKFFIKISHILTF